MIAEEAEVSDNFSSTRTNVHVQTTDKTAALMMPADLHSVHAAPHSHKPANWLNCNGVFQSVRC